MKFLLSWLFHGLISHITHSITGIALRFMSLRICHRQAFARRRLA